MSDLLERIRGEIRQRLAASRAAVEESARLEAALQALSGAHPQEAAAAQRVRTTLGSEPQARPAPSVQAARRRAPRGANRAAVLAAVAERPGASAAEIAASSGVTRRVVQAQLRQLVAEGLLAKRELPSGRGGYSRAANEDSPADPDTEQRGTAATTPGSPSTSPPSESSEPTPPKVARSSDPVDEAVAATDETHPAEPARPHS